MAVFRLSTPVAVAVGRGTEGLSGDPNQGHGSSPQGLTIGCQADPYTGGPPGVKQATVAERPLLRRPD